MILMLLAACAPERATITPVADVDVATPDTPYRPFRRMNIDQLAASMEAVSGHAWTESDGGETVDLFVTLSGSLGKPDYLSSTYEELSPGLLFQKFLDDAAKSVCETWVEAERDAPADTRVLLAHAAPTDTLETNPDAINADLAGALLRFHGRAVAPDDPLLEPWRSLHARGTEAHGDPIDGWRLVCIGLFTHPDFYTF